MDKILAIDDSPVQVELLRKILREQYEVITCLTAREGLKEALSGEYALVLLDVVMPDMDGFEVLRELKEASQTKYTPVILITGLTDVQNEEKGLVLGAVDYITKPFYPLIVKARVNTHIKLFHYQELMRSQAMVDELTGVANRRSYEENSLMRWRDSVRLGLAFSVCMMDIDKFKVYNDTFGHPAGDRVLATVAKTVSQCLRRSTDFFARYGGEEFVAIIVGKNALNAKEYMEKVRREVENLHMPHNPIVSQWVTLSMGGVTVTPKEGDSFDTYLKIADTMLYDAKRFGRNQVKWYMRDSRQF